MTTGRAGAIAVTLMLVISGARGQQAPPSTAPGPDRTGPTPAATRPTGTLGGRVLDGSSGRPIPGAIVTLTGLPVVRSVLAQPAPKPPAALTDENGHFVLRDLPAGRFGLSVTAAGYIAGSYGQRRPEGSTETIALGANATIGDADVRLWKAAAISGTVLDELGPAVQVAVTAMRRTMIRGRLSLTAAGTAQTDDRGMYRIFSLVPGDYVIVMQSALTSIPRSVLDDLDARDRNQDPTARTVRLETAAAGTSFPGGVSVGGQLVAALTRPLPLQTPDGSGTAVYPATFHPASAAPGGAAVVTLGSGDDREAIDLRIGATAAYRIAGVVTGPDGPVANAQVRLVPAYALDLASDNGFIVSTTSTDGQGRFTLLGATPGDYSVRAARMPRGAGPIDVTGNGDVRMTVADPLSGQPVPPGADLTYTAETRATVRDRDLNGMDLTLQPGARLSGHIEFTGGLAPRPVIVVQLRRLDGQTLPSLPSIRTDFRVGTFTSPQFPLGQYVVSLQVSDPSYVPKSMLVDGHDLLDEVLTLTRDVGDIILTVTDRLAEVSGLVQRSGNARDRGATVAIVPADVEGWIAGGMMPRRARLVDASETGRFEITGMPAGHYVIAALGPAAAVQLQDPKDVRAIARVGTPIALIEGTPQSVTLTPRSLP